MLLYVLRRLVLAVPLLIGITFVSFVVMKLAPGDPVEGQTGDPSIESTSRSPCSTGGGSSASSGSTSAAPSRRTGGR
jgi:ABC-type microcin C transport system permease subunit YejB